MFVSHVQCALAPYRSPAAGVISQGTYGLCLTFSAHWPPTRSLPQELVYHRVHMVCVSCSVRTGPLPQSAAGVISQGTYGLCLMFSAHWPPTAVCRRSYNHRVHMVCVSCSVRTGPLPTGLPQELYHRVHMVVSHVQCAWPPTAVCRRSYITGYIWFVSHVQCGTGAPYRSLPQELLSQCTYGCVSCSVRTGPPTAVCRRSYNHRVHMVCVSCSACALAPYRSLPQELYHRVHMVCVSCSVRTGPPTAVCRRSYITGYIWFVSHVQCALAPYRSLPQELYHRVHMVCVSCSVRTGPLPPQSAAGVIITGTYGLCLMFSAHWAPTAVCRRSYITGYIWFVSHVQCALGPLPQSAAGVISQGTYGLCLMFSAHWPPTAVCRRSYITGYIWLCLMFSAHWPPTAVCRRSYITGYIWLCLMFSAHWPPYRSLPQELYHRVHIVCVSCSVRTGPLPQSAAGVISQGTYGLCLMFSAALAPYRSPAAGVISQGYIWFVSHVQCALAPYRSLPQELYHRVHMVCVSCSVRTGPLPQSAAGVISQGTYGFGVSCSVRTGPYRSLPQELYHRVHMVCVSCSVRTGPLPQSAAGFISQGTYGLGLTFSAALGPLPQSAAGVISRVHMVCVSCSVRTGPTTGSLPQELYHRVHMVCVSCSVRNGPLPQSAAGVYITGYIWFVSHVQCALAPYRSLPQEIESLKDCPGNEERGKSTSYAPTILSCRRK
ncbi:hypothetical protein DPMN_019610 [Dreissena polymorpha]|uniref:Uncharacterized protein n=1 Tax=Dreissena polymorpha TaxID=45954 RepID=A0A9D4NIR2_DREPO|nr:hypothetical protein DPMN_019610 [Dreissena polymorpha]